MKSDQSQSWLTSLQSLEAAINDVPGDSLWNNSGLLKKTFTDVQKSFEKDLEDIEKESKFVFYLQGDLKESTEQTVDIIRKWHLTKHAPSLPALCAFIALNLGVKIPENLKKSILLAGVLGEVENEVDYHNNMHFRKVLLHTLRLIIANNAIYEGTDREFKPAQVALLMIAACIHDLGHDGLGNTVRGVFYQGRLEKRSFELAKPYLEAAGLDNEDQLEDLRTMLLCTEVTPLDDPGNPMNQMKAAYRFHFMGDKKRTHTLNLDPDLTRLEKSSCLTLMSLILHEADIATSAGLTYEITKYETAILMNEFGIDEARPKHIIDFLNQVCQRQFISDAGVKLYATNLARIYALAEEDLNNGDQPLPPAEHSDFLLLHGKGDGAPKTIN